MEHPTRSEHEIRDTHFIASGTPLEEAEGAVILVHGRGASAESMLPLAQELDNENLAYILPQATNYTWYPQSFLAPVKHNQPHLDNALNLIDELVDRIEEQGIDLNRVLLLGFSQGACLSSEYIARKGRPKGLIAFSGGVIGEEVDESNYLDTLQGIQGFIGCSDVDPHIPLERVNATYEVFHSRGADVQKKIYPNMPHTVNKNEMEIARQLVNEITNPQEKG